MKKFVNKAGKKKTFKHKGKAKVGGKDPYAKKYKVSNGIVVRSIGHNPIPKYCDVSFHCSYDCILLNTSFSAGGFHYETIQAYPYRPFGAMTVPTASSGCSNTANGLAWFNFMTTAVESLGGGGGLFNQCFTKGSKLSVQLMCQPNSLAGVGLDQFQVALLPLNLSLDPVVATIQEAQEAPNSRFTDVTAYTNGKLTCYTDTVKMVGQTFSELFSNSAYTGLRTADPAILMGYQLVIQSMSNAIPSGNIIIRLALDVATRLYQPSRTEETE